MIVGGSPHLRRAVGRWALGVLALGFGVATLVEGGHVLFGGPAARAAAGAVVPFVLVFNVGAGPLYLLAGAATLGERVWAVWVARALALATLGVLAALAVHVVRGGAYEHRTVVAMSLRSAFWVMQALALPHVLVRSGS